MYISDRIVFLGRRTLEPGVSCPAQPLGSIALAESRHPISVMAHNNEVGHLDKVAWKGVPSDNKRFA